MTNEMDGKHNMQKQNIQLFKTCLECKAMCHLVQSEGMPFSFILYQINSLKLFF